MIQIYRQLAKEVKFLSRSPGQHPNFSSLLKNAFESGNEADLRYAHEVLLFLRSQRKYSELLELYNPGATMTQKERNRLTARRVGLNLPKLNSDDFYKK